MPTDNIIVLLWHSNLTKKSYLNGRYLYDIIHFIYNSVQA